MLIPKDINAGPHGLWSFTHPVTGQKFSGAYSIARLTAMIDDYTTANGLDQIVGLTQLIIDQNCERDPDFCYSTEPPTFAQRARSFAQAATDWVSSGFKHVTHEQFEARKEICLKCPYWNGEAAFGYGGCRKCGCSGLKLFLPTQKCPDGRWGTLNV